MLLGEFVGVFVSLEIIAVKTEQLQVRRVVAANWPRFVLWRYRINMVDMVFAFA